MCRFQLQQTIYDAPGCRIFQCTDVVYTQVVGPQPRPQSTIAIKCVPTTMTNFDGIDDENKDIHDPSLREYRVVTALLAVGGHRHVVDVFEQFVHNSAIYTAMEYCTGGDLYQVVSSSPTGAIDEPTALRYLRETAAGVEFLHATTGYAHRDLSLENVLLQDGICKITDFGASTRIDEWSDESVGKKLYMAPEVVAGTRYDPAKVDVWALGIMLFMMLTGSPLVEVARSRTGRLSSSLNVVWGRF